MQKVQSLTSNLGRRLVVPQLVSSSSFTHSSRCVLCQKRHFEKKKFGKEENNEDTKPKFEFGSFTETPKNAEREFYRQRYEERLMNEMGSSSDGIDLESAEHSKSERESDMSMLMINRVFNPVSNNSQTNQHSNTIDGNNRTSMTEIMKHFELEYSRLDRRRSENIASRASVVPGMKHLFVLQLRHPLNSQVKIHLLGVRQESASDTDGVFKEIHTVLDAVKPSTLIVQTCEERFEKFIERMEASKRGGVLMNDTLSVDWSGLLDPAHLAYSARYALSIIHTLARDESHHSRLNDGDLLTQHNRIDVFALTANFANERMDSTEKIILGDLPASNLKQQTDGQLFDDSLNYMSRTTVKQRRNLGNYPGIREVLLGFNSVSAINDWIANNKSYIRTKERQVHQFAQDMQFRMNYGQGLIDRSAKSLCYFAFREGLPDQSQSDSSEGISGALGNEGEPSMDDDTSNVDADGEIHDDVDEQQIKNILVLCNVTTMLSIPLHFGQVSLAELIAMRKQQTAKERRLSLVRRWTLNYWNGFCWTVCGMHTMTHFLFAQPIDETHLLTFGLLLPLGYPTLFVILSLRARLRTRKLLRIYQENKKSKSILTRVNSKLTVS